MLIFRKRKNYTDQNADFDAAKWKSLNNSDASQNDLFSLVLMSTNYNDRRKRGCD
jgi:hypothetical protein